VARKGYLGAAAAVVGFAVFVGLWALTAYYSAYIFCLFLLVYFGTLLFVNGQTFAAARSIIVERPWYLAVIAGAMAIAGALILTVYGRALGHTHNLDAVRAYAGGLFDLLNVGNGNALWSSILAPIYKSFTGVPLATSEKSSGFTPVLLLAFVGATFWLMGQRRIDRSLPTSQAIALSVACVAIAILSLKFRQWMPWESFFLYAPGAQALRVPMRFLLLLHQSLL